MPRSERLRTTSRYPRPEILMGGRKQARLMRFDDAMSAEDDYFRFANRNR